MSLSAAILIFTIESAIVITVAMLGRNEMKIRTFFVRFLGAVTAIAALIAFLQASTLEATGQEMGSQLWILVGFAGFNALLFTSAHSAKERLQYGIPRSSK